MLADFKSKQRQTAADKRVLAPSKAAAGQTMLKQQTSEQIYALKQKPALPEDLTGLPKELPNEEVLFNGQASTAQQAAVLHKSESAHGREASTSSTSAQRPKETGTHSLPFFARLKKVKNFEIYIAVALILVMVAIYLTTLGGAGTSNKSSGTANMDNDAYARELEAQLVSTLSNVKNAGKVSAMVTVVGSASLEIAYNSDEKSVTQSGSGGSATTTTTITKTPVIVNGPNGPQPLVLLEIKPKLKGVVIVASGAADIGVRMQLLRAVEALVADNSVHIEILTGN